MEQNENSFEQLDEALASVFEERAEHLSPYELASWTTYTSKDEIVIHKLMGPGAKLLIGPRGSGKSTLLRTAYYRLQEENEALAAYVNYAKSLALEPLFHNKSNALQLFRHWVVMKIVIGIADSLKEIGRSFPNDLDFLSNYARQVVQQLENGQVPDLSNNETLIAPSKLVELLENWSLILGLKRCVLLLDDAAHAFSPEQQREFFEIFREIRSRRVSGKAAVYPGITSYSPNFHVGNEAELLEAWYRPDSEEYLQSMRNLVAKRLPESMSKQLLDRPEIVDYLALAAFGLPRGFLNMISQFFDVEQGHTVSPRPTQRATNAVENYASTVRGIFRALSIKLPRFKHFIEVGYDLESGLIRVLRRYNKLMHTNEAESEVLPPSIKRTTVVAIEEPISPELERMLNMLEYAGIIRKQGSVSRGIIGRFQRYAVHHAIVIAENALSLGRNSGVSTVVETITSRDAHSFARVRDTVLLGEKYRDKCKLDLPPCVKCDAPRVNEDQRFCMKCGAELTNASIYNEVLRAPISILPLTQSRIERIIEHTSIRTIQDILLDDEVQSLLRVPYIGPVWSARIRNYAEEFASV